MTRRSSCLAALVVAVGTGCGGGGADRGEVAAPRPIRAPAQVPPATAATRAALVATAKRICARMDARMRVALESQQARSPAQVRAIVDAWARTIAELHDLRPPPQEARRFRRMLASFDSAIRAARAIGRGTDEEALVPFAVMADAGMRGAGIADEYGLLACSIFPPAPSRAEFERYVLQQARKPGGLLDRRRARLKRITGQPLGRG